MPSGAWCNYNGSFTFDKTYTHTKKKERENKKIPMHTNFYTGTQRPDPEIPKEYVELQNAKFLI